jgi:hypothetical protein
VRLRWREESPWVLTLLLVAAALPFVPGAIEFMRRGIPDVLFTGDGAAIELGTLHAAHGVQLVGPYSRFGWSHPGPAFSMKPQPGTPEIFNCSFAFLCPNTCDDAWVTRVGTVQLLSARPFFSAWR